MKKLKITLSTALAFIAALMSTSCNVEELYDDSYSDAVLATEATDSVTTTAQAKGTISLVVEGEEEGTRSYSSGIEATGTGAYVGTLHYAIYRITDDNTYEKVSSSSVSMDEWEFNKSIDLNFALGSNYKIVFLRCTSFGFPTFDDTSATLTTSYGYLTKTNTYNSNWGKITETCEDRDAFWNTLETGTVTGDFTATVPLYRPVAQLNIGTDDVEDNLMLNYYGVTWEDLKIKVTLHEDMVVYMDLLSGEGIVSDDDVSLVIDTDYNIIDSYGDCNVMDEYIYPVDGYRYLQCSYILAGKGKTSSVINESETISKMVIEISADKLPETITHTLYNVPLKRNYRTNIYGSLLQMDTEASGKITVSCQPTFTGSENSEQ